jgi:hypothetical protein
VNAIGWASQTDHVAVWVDDSAFVLPPLSVLRRVHLDARRTPFGRQVVSVVNEQVGSASAAIVVGYDAEVDLDTVPGREAVAAAGIGPDIEAQSLIEVHRTSQVTDSKDRRYSLHRLSFAGLRRTERGQHAVSGMTCAPDGSVCTASRPSC